MMIDPNTNTTDPLSVGLHTMISDLMLSESSSQNIIAQYIPPEPPGSSPHNYTLLLYKQPDNFTISSLYDSYFTLDLSNVLNRVNFPLQQFVHQTGVDGPVAANWFREGASTSTSTASALDNSTSTSSATRATSSSAALGLSHLNGRFLALLPVLGAIKMGIII